jgi:hypothetical protein
LGISNPTDRRCRETIGSDYGKDRRIERGVSSQPSIQIGTESILAIELVDYLEPNASRTEPIDGFNEALPAESLRFCGFAGSK